MARERDDEGKYTEMATIDAVMDVLASADDPVLTANEVGEVIGVSSETARRKLTDLYEERRVERKDVGARAVVWWLTADEGEN
jgi:response regulator of citrate/malate metabolism